MSWPVAGTLMIEPTESESKPELDRFCDAMIAIREEIRAVEAGQADAEVNVLTQAPHTAADLVSDWDRPYDRATAVFPTAWTRDSKFWPAVNRIDQAYGDRNLMCSWPNLPWGMGPHCPFPTGGRLITGANLGWNACLAKHLAHPAGRAKLYIPSPSTRFGRREPDSKSLSQIWERDLG
jgi:hypothetical protein